MLASESLGTGNSQWLVVDYNRRPERESLGETRSVFAVGDAEGRTSG